MEGTVTLTLNDYNKLLDEKEMTKMVCYKYIKRSKALERYLSKLIEEADEDGNRFACFDVEEARKALAEARADLNREEEQ